MINVISMFGYVIGIRHVQNFTLFKIIVEKWDENVCKLRQKKEKLLLIYIIIVKVYQKFYGS